MTIGERLNHLRENILKISQEELGNKIGVSRFSISNYESGKRNLTDRVITDVCRECGANEEWLRSGEGNPLIPEDMTYLYNVGKLGSEQNEFKKFYLNMMMNLPDEYWDYIYKEFKKFDKKNKE